MKVNLSDFSIEVPEGPQTAWSPNGVVTITYVPAGTRRQIPAAIFGVSSLLDAILAIVIAAEDSAFEPTMAVPIPPAAASEPIEDPAR